MTNVIPRPLLGDTMLLALDNLTNTSRVMLLEKTGNQRALGQLLNRVIFLTICTLLFKM